MDRVRCIGGPLDGRLVAVVGPKVAVPAEPAAIAALPMAARPDFPTGVYFLQKHALFPTAQAYVWSEVPVHELLARWPCQLD
jgi:hypothetical protein